jgi:hypothetical protein
MAAFGPLRAFGTIAMCRTDKEGGAYMTPANVTAELHLLLWMIGVVFVAGAILGALTPGTRRSILALLHATAFTAVGMLATVRPADPVDGQTGLGIPIMWVPFFVVSWLGLFIGAALASNKRTNREP